MPPATPGATPGKKRERAYVLFNDNPREKGTYVVYLAFPACHGMRGDQADKVDFPGDRCQQTYQLMMMVSKILGHL